MKEVEFFLKGGGSFVCEVVPMVADDIKRQFYHKDAGFRMMFDDSDGVMMVDLREVAAINVREAQEQTTAGFMNGLPPFGAVSAGLIDSRTGKVIG